MLVLARRCSQVGLLRRSVCVLIEVNLCSYIVSASPRKLLVDCGGKLSRERLAEVLALRRKLACLQVSEVVAGGRTGRPL